MSRLNIVLDLDLEEKTIIFEEKFDEGFMFFDICVGIRKKSDYDNLSFGYSIERNNTPLEEVFRPEPNITYICSDQEFIDFYKIDCDPEIGNTKIDNYIIDFWCEEGGVRFEKSHSFQVTVLGIVDPYPDGIDATPESVGKEHLLDTNNN